MGNILSRIQDIASNEGITIGALERCIGASKGVLSRAINNGTDIQSKWITILVENYPQYSPAWLLTGEGNTDSAVTVLGYIAGAAFAHNFSLAGSAASADSIGGPSINGKVAVIIGLVVMLAIAALNTAKARKDA